VPSEAQEEPPSAYSNSRPAAEEQKLPHPPAAKRISTAHLRSVTALRNCVKPPKQALVGQFSNLQNRQVGLSKGEQQLSTIQRSLKEHPKAFDISDVNYIRIIRRPGKEC